MRIAAAVLPFLPIGKPRPAKATLLRDDTLPGVQRVIALAPILGRRNPKSLATVEHIMLNLIGDGPDGGIERNVDDHEEAADVRHATTKGERRRASVRQKTAQVNYFADPRSAEVAYGFDLALGYRTPQDVSVVRRRSCA
jgi:hypothetical protein